MAYLLEAEPPVDISFVVVPEAFGPVIAVTVLATRVLLLRLGHRRVVLPGVADVLDEEKGERKRKNRISIPLQIDELKSAFTRVN